MTSSQVHCPDAHRRLILASASPRRRDLLLRLGLDFEIDSSDVTEVVTIDAGIQAQVRHFAVQKAREVAGRHTDALIIAADTLVEVEGCVFGKPADEEDARLMLRALSGRHHRVSTCVAVLDTATQDLRSRLAETSVYFRHLSDSEIEAYIQSGEPLDKAGAYGIQGLGGVFVSRIDGDYHNVAGLPIADLNDLLRECGCCLICHHRGVARPA